MRMRRCHAIQLAREAQQAENRRRAKEKQKPKRKNIISRLLGIK